LNRLNHFGQQLHHCGGLLALLVLVLLVTHVVDDRVVVVTVLPPVLVDALLLTVVKLLHKARNQTLGHLAVLRVELFALKRDFKHSLHVLAFGEHLEKRFLLQNVLQNEGGVHDGLIFTRTGKFFDEG